MHIIRGLQNLTSSETGCVATIGNFDGVHLGHRAVIENVVAWGQAQGLPAVLITFEPYPQEVIRPDPAIARLTRFREKMLELERTGLSHVLCLKFDHRLASMGAEEFIHEILIKRLRVKHLIVGDDFRFGKQRRGDFGMLSAFGNQYGYTVESTPTFEVAGARVSSTRVREALRAGNMRSASELLGRDYYMLGRVAHGDKRGRQIGFPTANIHLHRISAPVQGVYAVTMEELEGKALPGIANIGSRPTVDGLRCLLEVHLFDFDREIYGSHVKVNFVHFIRSEKLFDGLEALKEQISKDCDMARLFHSSRT